MIQTLLLPLDHSETSHNALNRALKVAACWHLTVVGQPVAVGRQTVPAILGNQGDPLLHDFAVHCDAWHVDHEVRIHSDLTPGTLRSHLREAAVDAVWLPNVDTPARRTASPSLLAALVHESPIMVWVSHPDSVLPTRLTVAYDGNPQAQEALMVAANLARQWQLPLHLHLITAHDAPVPGALNLAQTVDRLAVLGQAPVTAEHRIGAAAAHLSEATRPDTLLILGAHWPPAGPWARHDSTLDRVLDAAAGSVLVCPAPDLW